MYPILMVSFDRKWIQYMGVLLIGKGEKQLDKTSEFVLHRKFDVTWEKIFPPVSEEGLSYQTYNQTTLFHLGCLFTVGTNQFLKYQFTQYNQVFLNKAR